MHYFIAFSFGLAVVGIVVGQAWRGAPLLGLALGLIVGEAAISWWRLRSSDTPTREVADRLAISVAIVSLALASAAPWESLAAWLEAWLRGG